MKSQDTRNPDVGEWLKSIGLEEYAGTFAENRITFDTLHELTDADLKECGLAAVGHRKEILGAIRSLKLGGTAEATDVPKKLAHFEVLEEIGHGGMGRVFRAWDTALERQVALKQLNRELADADPQFVRDFVREARSAAAVNHPRIVQIYFAGEDQGEYFLAMELLEGQSLAERIERGPIDEKMALRIARHVVEALAATSTRRLIHGDIKPHNIFLAANGDAKLLDFGLARKGNASPENDGFITGSAAYISPERAKLEPEDFRSDIYSLGVTLFEALSGMLPFDAPSAAELAVIRIHHDAPRLRTVKPAASEAVDELLARMLARDVRGRHSSYEELLANIEAAAGRQTSRIQTSSAMEIPQPAEAGEDAGGGRKTLWQVMTSRRFLFVSIAIHLVILIIAAAVVVQTISTKRKLTFSSAPPAPNPSQRALEHRVQMAKKQNTMSAPAQPKRIASAGLAKVSLPDMPAMPSSDLAPSRMTGMAGTGFGTGPLGVASGSPGGGGGGIPFFGLRTAGAGLRGTFYDLKQSLDGKPSEMVAPAGERNGWDGINEPTNKLYDEIIMRVVRGGMNESAVGKYFRGPVPLYATQFYIPKMDANNGPQAFNLADKVQPKRWIVVYSGKVTAPESGRYRFVGWGDDILIVRYNGRIVLDGSLTNPTGRPRKNGYRMDGLPWLEVPVGETLDIPSGIANDMEILIGERPGGHFSVFLLIEKVGANYEKSSSGSPKLPIFKLAPSETPEHGDNVPLVAPDTSWSIWKGQPRQSLFKSL